jgi:hypothetical protein
LRLRLVGKAEDAAADLWCATMSLPWLLGIDAVEKIPLDPWFHLPVTKTAEAGRAAPAGGTQGGAGAGRSAATRRAGAPRPRQAAGPAARRDTVRAGINWAGNPAFAYDRTRSAHLSDLANLLVVPGIEWVSLHKGHREAEAAAVGLPQPLVTARDFLDTAEVLATLDLVVSTETAVPNLSGALGIPTCVLAARDHDWRWRAWYRDVTVCVQDRPGSWAGAVKQACSWVRSRTARAA